MKSFELNCTHRSQSNMGSNIYELVFRKQITVRKFIEEILEDGREWGVVRVDIGEDHYWDNPTCEYSRGKLISKLPEEYLDRIIVSGKSGGCWGNMDYWLKMKELPEVTKDVEMEGEKVDVIRCKDCKYFNRERLVCGRPFETTINKRMPDDYCSRAVRRKDHANNDL